MDEEEIKMDMARKKLEKYAEPICKTVDETPLPPLRRINHKIPIIDDKKQYSWRASKCPEPLRPLWTQKRDSYINSGRWKVATGSNAIPMIMLRKPTKDPKDVRLRTVLDCRERNANCRKLTSPLPDIEEILRVVSKHPYVSLIDGKDAYEQIRVDPDDVSKTVFNTPDGTMVSLVMQQGDCNAGATYQTLMNSIFSDYIGVFIYIYLDDMAIFSLTLDDHIKHCKLVID